MDMATAAQGLYDYNLRTRIYHRQAEFGVTDDSSQWLKFLLTGEKGISYRGKTDIMSADERRLCELLAGPNGYAIYKMLLARQVSNGRS